MKNEKLGILNIALIYVGTIMGAGFASGREIWQFFGVFGNQGYIGVGFVGLLFIIIGIMTSRIARKLNTNNMGKVIVPSGNKLLITVVGYFMALMLFTVLVTMSAAGGALRYKSEKKVVFSALNDSTKTVVAFVAPAVRAVVASYYKIPAEEATPFMSGMLKKLGFDKVFDNAFGADLTILEETTEFLTRVTSNGVMPQFTSCCPGWVNLVERRYPELIPHLSTCKSPQMMMGATLKSHYAQLTGIDKKDIFTVSIVPCIAKKYEAKRPEFAPDGAPDVDAVLNSGEMLEMMELKGIEGSDVVPQEYDEPYKMASGAGILFGNSGGVAEAALRMAVEKLSGVPLTDHLDFTEIRGFDGVKETTVEANGIKVRVAVISGINNAEPIV